MSDQNRRLGERADLRLVVIDDLGQAEAFQRLGVLTQRLDVTLLTRPFGRRDGIAEIPKVVGEVLPAASREPRAVDQHQRRPVCGGFHVQHPSQSLNRTRYADRTSM